jgi:sulfite oxidase
MILDMAGVQATAQNVVVYGAERGNFSRGLRIEKAYDPDTILAYAMNGEPLPVVHGAPVRLVVPGWIGVASVKWVGRIEVIDRPYEGFYNTQRYVFERPDQERTPVTLLGVKSAIARPRPGEVLPAGSHVIAGYAWSGAGEISSVEVSADNWQTSRSARLLQTDSRWAWTRFEYVWEVDRPGRYTLASRATDAAGNTQPEQAEWNRFGYGMNAIYALDVEVR